MYRMPHSQYLTSYFEISTQETIARTISNEICITSFGFSMRNL
jgi:hypothetical protein